MVVHLVAYADQAFRHRYVAKVSILFFAVAITNGTQLKGYGFDPPANPISFWLIRASFILSISAAVVE